MEEKEELLKSIRFPLFFVLLLWVIKVVEWSTGISFVEFGLYPRQLSGLLGILTFPLIHGSWDHLMSNSLPAFFLMFGIMTFYPSGSKATILFLYFIPGILLWLFGRTSYHIGASGLIYGMAAFLFFSGIIRRDKRAIIVSLLVTFFYGGMVWGILPLQEGISWEGHLFGAVTGIILAIIFRKNDPYKKPDWDEEDEKDYNVRDLEVSYKKGYPFE